MSTPKSICTVKGRIREWNYCTNHGLIRKGSMHFLPGEEVALYNEWRIMDFAFNEHRLSVRGKHRSGLFKAKRTHVRFLEDLHIHRIESPSQETMDFLERNGIMHFPEGSGAQRTIDHVIKELGRREWPKAEETEINDDQFMAAQAFAIKVKSLFTEKRLEKVIDDHVKFPLINNYWRDGKKKSRVLKHDELMPLAKEIFSRHMIESVLNTEIDTLYPCEKKMILGTTEVEISRDHEFRISSIESW